jgi:uncharacterized OsmC-like protein
VTTTTERVPLNGVDTPKLFATLDAVKAQPEIATFQFRAKNKWVSGTRNRSSIHGFYGVGQELEHRNVTVIEADHPTQLVGEDHGPAPVEYVLAALAACLTSGLANIAAARGIALTEVESTVEGDINLLGVLGMSDEIRNGYEQIRVSFKVKGNAPPEKLRALVERSKDRSAVFDVITNSVPIALDVSVG